MIARHILLATAMALFTVPVAAQAQGAAAVQSAPRAQIVETMKRATRFMVDKMAYRGGYLWSYLPAKSRVWGELEAYPTMVWVQPPGTATMGHLFLDAYHATGDEFYYQAAAKAADALATGQLPRGGWNYFIDFGGPESTRRWYETIGRNAWRMEEFQHAWGNATFDDGGTGEAIRFLTRIYAEKRDARFRAPLEKAIDFVLASQLPNGGWPQRWPRVAAGGLHGQADYTGLITFNDGVIADNVDVLITYHKAVGDARIMPAIARAMQIYVATQQPAPQAGWGLQHNMDLKPAAARTYEPRALVTHTTASNVEQLMQFYRMTGDPKFLARIPEALDWLESVRLPAAEAVGGREFPTFVEIGSNKALYVHRRGSNVVNGAYYVDYDPADTIGHYNARRAIDVARLRRDYAALKATAPDSVAKDSPLRDGRQPLKRFWLAGAEPGKDGKNVAAVIASLNAEGYWPTRLQGKSHAYTREGSQTVKPGDFRSTDVGDETDTSPYDTPDAPVAISLAGYIDNMSRLVAAVEQGAVRLPRTAIVMLAALSAAPAAHAATADGWYAREDFRPVRRIAIRIANHLDHAVKATPVVITPDQIPELAGAHELTVTLVDPTAAPRPEPTKQQLAVMGPHGIRKEVNGRAIAMQMDDLDRDGVWDELFFQADLKPRETRTYHLYLGFQQRGWNLHGSNAAIGSYMRHMVPFWESGHVGWKLWFPDSADVYGKRKNVLLSNQILGNNWDGYAVSYIDQAFGSDIMSVDDSFGGGGIALFETPGSDALSRPRFSPNADAKERWNTNTLKDTRYAFDVIVNGPLRSMVRIRTMNWNTGKGRYALDQVYTSYANHNYATAKVRFTDWRPDRSGVRFAAGIRRKEGETLGHRAGNVVVTTAPEAIRNPDDTDSTQNALKVAYAGSALVVKDMYRPKHVSIAAQQGNEVFRFAPRPDNAYEYMIAAGWSEGEVLKTAAEFRDYVIGVAREYNVPARLADYRIETRPAP